jgi:hypothetical protein
VIQEDGLVETLTALSYLASFLVALSLAVRLYGRERLLGVLYFLLAFIFLFLCLKEIS